MADTDRISALEEQIASLNRRLTIREDELDIRKLQHLYGYLIDKCMYDEVVELFADDAQVHFFGGVWRGKDSIRRLYVDRFRKRFTHDNNGPIDGFLLDHPQLQDLITINEDGITARNRCRSMMQAGRHKDYCDPGNPAAANPRQWWEGGVYENQYKKVDGKWRFLVLNYFPHWHADFKEGWAYTESEFVPFFRETYPTDPEGPDELSEGHWLWPTHKLVPFHMKHPITGKEMKAERWQGDIDRESAHKDA
ncbi:MAG: nuclear transport factor 2 family protein [Sphingobium sp.]|nr:nuclear transport factor 2 family protein [Sphingobium sp.]